jgi:putative toxin-antitoxin system antitoxin component (TIGR02293 family)
MPSGQRKRSIDSNPAPSSFRIVRPRATGIRAAAIEVWGNPADATAWLNRPQAQLGGATPESLLQTAEGTERVANLLSALDNGFPV